MRHLAILLVFPFLWGCSAPTAYFRDAAVVQVQVDGDVFDIRRRGTLAEAIRRNSRWAPRMGEVGARAARAMAGVTGCAVTEIRGDAALILGKLACDTGAGTPPLVVAGQTQDVLVCGVDYAWHQLDGRELVLGLGCN